MNTELKGLLALVVAIVVVIAATRGIRAVHSPWYRGWRRGHRATWPGRIVRFAMAPARWVWMTCPLWARLVIVVVATASGAAMAGIVP